MKNIFAIIFCAVSISISAQSINSLIVDAKIDPKGHKEKVLDLLKTTVIVKKEIVIDPKIEYESAQKNMKLKDYSAALTNYNQLLKIDKKNSKYLLERAKCYLIAGDFQNALIEFDYTLRVNAKEFEAYLGRSKARNLNRDYQGALEDAEKYLLNKPNSSEALSEKATALRKLGRGNEAINLADKILKDKPTDFNALKTIAFENFQNKKYDLATNEFSQLITLNPNEGTLYFNKGICEFNLQKIKSACENWKQAKVLGVQQADKYLKQFCK